MLLHTVRVDEDVLARVVHRDDRGVVERGRGLRLAAVPGLEGRVSREVGAQHLDRDRAAQAGVVADVDLSHAATTDELADLVTAGEDAGFVLRH